MRTEIPFTLPRGLTDEAGGVHTDQPELRAAASEVNTLSEKMNEFVYRTMKRPRVAS